MSFMIIRDLVTGEFAIAADSDVLLKGIESLEKAKTFMQSLNDKLARLDFEGLYAKYPRKDGKTRGMRHLKRNCKSEKRLLWLHKCLNGYKSYLLINKVDDKYIKHFDSWLSVAGDYEQYANDLIEMSVPSFKDLLSLGTK